MWYFVVGSRIVISLRLLYPTRVGVLTTRGLIVHAFQELAPHGTKKERGRLKWPPRYTVAAATPTSLNSFGSPVSANALNRVKPSAGASKRVTVRAPSLSIAHMRVTRRGRSNTYFTRKEVFNGKTLI